MRITNLLLVAMILGMGMLFGFLTYAILQLIVLSIAGSIGIWLFYTQHQFEGAYWQQDDDWSYDDAALKGSAFLELPAVLRWFTGNIGFHHIHHLSPRVPNYNLERCHEAISALGAQVREVTLWTGLKALRLHLWDEASNRLVSFRQARAVMV